MWSGAVQRLRRARIGWGPRGGRRAAGVRAERAAVEAVRAATVEVAVGWWEAVARVAVARAAVALAEAARAAVARVAVPEAG